MMGYIPNDEMKHMEPRIFEPTNEEAVNWVTKGAVTGVKDQGKCGSCWSFSATGALEAAHWQVSGQLISFSEQQLVDCDMQSHNCQGGFQKTAFEYWMHFPAMTEQAYPYFSGTTQGPGYCQFNPYTATGVFTTNRGPVQQNSVSALKAAVAHAPVAVSIEADKQIFLSYKSGVFDSTDCGTQLDHAVLLVGYGTDDATGKDYWIMKNSWNTSWGEQGYMRMAIVDGQGTCGVQMAPIWVSSI